MAADPTIVESVSEAISGMWGVIRNAQSEKTNRIGIKASRDMAVEEINAKAKVLHILINKGANERELVYKELFKKMDIILTKDEYSDKDIQIFQMMTNMITAQINNPTMTLDKFQGEFIGISKNHATAMIEE